MAIPDCVFKMIIVGGGPAGIAPLLAAHRMGRLDTLLSEGVAVIEQGESLGSGSLGNYAINSDSSGRTFVDCLLSDSETELTRLADHPLTRQIASVGDGTVSLHDAGRFLGLVGHAVARMIGQHSASAVMTGHSVKWARRVPGGWRVHVHNLTTGAHQTLMTQNLVVATGAHQPAERLAREEVGGVRLEDRCGDRLMQSGDVLSNGGLQRVEQLLSGKASPQVAIIGGSTSAAAVAHALLHRLPNITFGESGITLLHRRALRIYYPDRASALAEGYDEWTEDDVCPISGRVFRFAGFRLDSRELVMQARGIGGREPEPRLRLTQIADDESELAGVLDRADLVVAAMGYRPRAVPLYDYEGHKIDLLAETGPQMAMVDGQCRVLDARGIPLENLFGIGLAAGFVPRGALGGEPSFRGQANGLWLWQHDVGALIVNAVSEASVVEEFLLIKARQTPSPANLNIPFENRAAAMGGE